MTEDFALLDFALSTRSQAEIAEALGNYRGTEHSETKAEAVTPPPKRFLARLLKRKSVTRSGSTAPGGLLIQPQGTLGPVPLTRTHLTGMGYGSENSPVRLSAPHGVGGLTLIEFRDGERETSLLCEFLSNALHGDEIFYFRHSGSLHPGAHFAFHVYQQGRATRRAASFCAENSSPDSEWFGVDAGMPHALEAGSLPSPDTPGREIMTPVRQATILDALGIDPDTLFEQERDDLITLELSSTPGGSPVSEARHMITRARHPRPPAPVTEPVSEPVFSSAPRPSQPEETHPPKPTWEEEVTGLLVGAVEAALPAEQQVAWLESLTMRLMSGEVEAALTDATDMIMRGNRTETEKADAAARLSKLFHDGPSYGGGSH